MTDGWGQGAAGGWGSPDDDWSQASSPGGQGDGGFGREGGGSDWGGPAAHEAFTLPKPVSVAPLLVGILLGLLGIVLSRFGTPTNVAAPVVGWLLCTLGDVLAVAFYQRRDLEAAFDSMNYRPAGSASVLRTVALALAAVGIVANSIAIAHWVATR